MFAGEHMCFSISQAGCSALKPCSPSPRNANAAGFEERLGGPTVTGFVVQRTGSFSQALMLSAGLSLLSAASYLMLVRQPIQSDPPG